MNTITQIPSLTQTDQEPLAGTVKPYQQHLAVCTGGPQELWAARVEEMEGLFSTLHQALRLRGLHKKIKLTACDATSTGAEGFDIFLMPDMLVLPEITIDKVERLADALRPPFIPPNVGGNKGGAEGLPFDVRPMAGGAHVFVCVHTNRDARCGEWGVPFYNALQEEVKRQDAIAHVYQTSHIGGHRFAATCIIYPQAIWYGNLRPEDASRLVAQHLNEEQLLPEHYRGRLGSSFCQQVAEAEAAHLLLSTYPSYESLTVNVQENNNRATAVAKAVVRGAKGYLKLRAEFELSRPSAWWQLDIVVTTSVVQSPRKLLASLLRFKKII
jgi:(2Fe-2S) ferredoxin